MKRLAIITSHPIQYNAPLFKLLTERRVIAIKVFYTWGESVLHKKFDPGFQKEISWDIPLLDGYEYTFVKNISKNPGSSHFNGINNPGLIDEIKSWNADAILIFGWAFKSHLQLMRYCKGRIPVFFRGDSTLLNNNNNNPIKKFVRKQFLKWVYSHVDAAFYVGSQNRLYFENGGLQNHRLYFAPHAIENSRFELENKTAVRKKIRDLNNIPEDAFVFLFAGKLESIKAPFLLGEAFELLKENSCHLIFAGSGILEASLKERFGKNQAIHFIGFQNQSQMPGLYNACDVFILPSVSETWGLAINEAMASGKAVIASDQCGATIDLIKENENGYSFKAGNSTELYNVLLKCIKQRNHINVMGEKSLHIIKEYSFINQARALENAVNNHKNLQHV